MHSVITGHPDAYAEAFDDDDVFDAFSRLFYDLGILFGEVDFTQLKKACIQRGTLLPSEFKEQIKAANELGELLDALDKPAYCNWLNIRPLKRIVKMINVPEAKLLIQAYEKSVYSRKVADVKMHIDMRCVNPSHVSSIKAKIMTSSENLTVADFIKYCQGLESIVGVSVTTTEYQSGCLLVTFVIPLHCALYAYETAKANFLKFRMFHIQYIEIGSFPKVFALKFPIEGNTLMISGILILQIL